MDGRRAAAFAGVGHGEVGGGDGGDDWEKDVGLFNIGIMPAVRWFQGFGGKGRVRELVEREEIRGWSPPSVVPRLKTTSVGFRPALEEVKSLSSHSAER